MLPVSDAELASIRAEAASAACDTPCTIQRSTITKDAWGSETQTYNTISPSGMLAGMKPPTAGQLANYDFLIGSLEAFQVQFPYGTDVQREDHLIIGGVTLVAQADLSPQSYNALVTFLATIVR